MKPKTANPHKSGINEDAVDGGEINEESDAYVHIVDDETVV